MYTTIAVLTFITLLFALPVKTIEKDVVGSALLAIIWPVLIPAGIYFTVKKFVFKRHGPSAKYFPLEALGCLLVTAAGCIFYFYPF